MKISRQVEQPTKSPSPSIQDELITARPWKVDDIFSSVFGYEVVDNNGNTIAIYPYLLTYWDL